MQAIRREKKSAAKNEETFETNGEKVRKQRENKQREREREEDARGETLLH